MGWIQSELTLQSSPRLNTRSNHLSKRAVRYQAQEFWQSRTNRDKLFATNHRKKRILIQLEIDKIRNSISKATEVQAAGKIETKASSNDFTRREFIKYNGFYTE